MDKNEPGYKEALQEGLDYLANVDISVLLKNGNLPEEWVICHISIGERNIYFVAPNKGICEYNSGRNSILNVLSPVNRLLIEQRQPIQYNMKYDSVCFNLPDGSSFHFYPSLQDLKALNDDRNLTYHSVKSNN